MVQTAVQTGLAEETLREGVVSIQCSLQGWVGHGLWKCVGPANMITE